MYKLYLKGDFMSDMSNCIHCDKQFPTRIAKGGEFQKFCSSSCAATVNNTKHPKRKLIDKFCLGCSNKIDRKSATDRRTYCSDCKPPKGTYAIKQKLIKIYAKRCIICQDQFTHHKSTVKTCELHRSGRAVPFCLQCGEKNGYNRSYCSSECKLKYKLDVWDWHDLSIEELKGEGNANSKSRLPYIRSLARKKYLASGLPQDCHICGYENFIEVAHVKDVSSFPPEALASEVNHIDNLLALCRNHHWEFDKMHLEITLRDGTKVQK
jgi:hypothetical protein